MILEEKFKTPFIHFGLGVTKKTARVDVPLTIWIDTLTNKDNENILQTNFDIILQESNKIVILPDSLGDFVVTWSSTTKNDALPPNKFTNSVVSNVLEFSVVS